MQITGILQQVFQTRVLSDKFKKRVFHVSIDNDKPYPQTICFELHQDKVGLIDGMAIGSQIQVDFNLRGRVYNNTCYNTLQAWKITSNQKAKVNAEAKDDLPF